MFAHIGVGGTRLGWRSLHDWPAALNGCDDNTVGAASRVGPKRPPSSSTVKDLGGEGLASAVASSQRDTANSRMGSSPAPQTPAAGNPERPSRRSTKLRGYFTNFDNGRTGSDRSDVAMSALAVAESKIAAHFAVTHRDPEEAAANFRAMLREKPKMALWAVHNCPLAFGEPTGIGKPGPQWRDVRALVPSSEKNDGPTRPVLPHSLDPVLAAERKRIREQTTRARGQQAAERAPAAIVASLTRLVEWLEREVLSDADTVTQVAHIRAVARGLRAAGTLTHDHDEDQGQRSEETRKNRAVP